MTTKKAPRSTKFISTLRRLTVTYTFRVVSCIRCSTVKADATDTTVLGAPSCHSASGPAANGPADADVPAGVQRLTKVSG